LARGQNDDCRLATPLDAQDRFDVAIRETLVAGMKISHPI
jgi:hypothetical protein